MKWFLKEVFIFAVAILAYLFVEPLRWLLCRKIDETSFRLRDREAVRSSPDKAGLKIRYIGTAGFAITSTDVPGRMVLLDPYFTKPTERQIIASLLFRKELIPNMAIIEEETNKILQAANEIDPIKSVDVLIGHSHVDHILDAPYVCTHLKNQGIETRFFGSKSSTIVAEKAFEHYQCRVPVENVENKDQAKTSEKFDEFPVGVTNRDECFDGTYEFVPIRSHHGSIRIPILGEYVPNPGFIEKLNSWPTRYGELKHGTILNWLVRFDRKSVLHIGSANLDIDDLKYKLGKREPDERQVDLLCLCAANWNGPGAVKSNYIERAIKETNPSFVTSCHWDWFCNPGTPKRRNLGLRLNLDKFYKELERLWCGYGKDKENILFLPFDSEIVLEK